MSKISIRFLLLHKIFLVVLTVSAILLGIQYYYAKKISLRATTNEFYNLSEKIITLLNDRDRHTKDMLCLLQEFPGISNPVTSNINEVLVRAFAAPMKRNQDIYAVYAGYGNGDLFEVVNLENDAELCSFYNAPDGSRWVVIKIFDKNGERIRSFQFLGEDFRLLGNREEQSAYMVNSRPWYLNALASQSVTRSNPYLFSNLKKEGITYSQKITDDNTVVAIDFTLDMLNDQLKKLKFSEGCSIVLATNKGDVIASSDNKINELDSNFLKAREKGIYDAVFSYEKAGNPMLGMIVPLSDDADDILLAFSVDEASMLEPYIVMMHKELGVAVGVMLLMLFPMLRFASKCIITPVKHLMEQNEKVKGRFFDQVRLIDTNVAEFYKLSASLVSMAKSISQYQEAQKELMNSFIRLIADAIDAKSQHTGGHCRRLPHIAGMILDEVNRVETGPFKSFRLDGDEAREEFELSAWLHDCGKIITPEYVVDKATKLETIYNRIHEIRTRFEVVWRDIEIKYLERLLDGEDSKELERWKREEHERLVDDFEFVAQCNIGGEFMDKEAKERILKIAKRTWLRHFDNRAGLSHEELERMEGDDDKLPATEHLLADSAYHKIKRVGFDEEKYRKQGFKLPVPELLYNRGEIYNLCIERGTLTEEERFKIQEHAIMSIRMLENLPFPENLKKIPEYAAPHHETLIGTGYPRRLTQEKLSVPARIMAIADIFEALTAWDRPYKRGKSLSETFRIMGFMAKDRHIDAELFALFVRSGVYLKYANEYLRPEQIDHVDVEKILQGIG